MFIGKKQIYTENFSTCNAVKTHVSKVEQSRHIGVWTKVPTVIQTLSFRGLLTVLHLETVLMSYLTIQ